MANRSERALKNARLERKICDLLLDGRWGFGKVKQWGKGDYQPWKELHCGRTIFMQALKRLYQKYNVTRRHKMIRLVVMLHYERNAEINPFF
jgi:hypothetical protein